MALLSTQTHQVLPSGERAPAHDIQSSDPVAVPGRPESKAGVGDKSTTVIPCRWGQSSGVCGPLILFHPGFLVVVVVVAVMPVYEWVERSRRWASSPAPQIPHSRYTM